MFGVKKVYAVLESKSVVEKKNAPIISQKMIFACAEESGSFMSKDIFYMLTFRIGKQKKEFRVTREVYERLREDDKGMLFYRSNFFEDFIMEKDEKNEKKVDRITG